MPLDEFMRGSEVFISSTAGGVMPLTRVDDVSFNGGEVGDVTRKIRARYWEWVGRADLRTEIEYE